MPKLESGCESNILQRVVVRWVRDEERELFDRLLEDRHDLASALLAGQTLRYVAELDGQWIALLTFSAAALQPKAREAWLGWTPRQRVRCVGLVVNSSRFLVLAERLRYSSDPMRSLRIKEASSASSSARGHTAASSISP